MLREVFIPGCLVPGKRLLRLLNLVDSNLRQAHKPGVLFQSPLGASASSLGARLFWNCHF
jgi:hypothetical protein